MRVICASHVDRDGDGVCDICFEIFVCNHADADGDNYCDDCKRYLIVELLFYGINDIHGTYVDAGKTVGVSSLTSYLLSAQKNSNAIVLSQGDMWQGGSESNNTKGKLATEWMNYINCVSMTLGNHEFDWSTEKIRENASLVDFPFLAINVYDRETNKRVSYCDASVICEVGGIKVGIIGAIGDCYSSISSSMCEDVYFKTGDELTSLVKAEAERLRNEEGVNYIIYSLHDSVFSNGYDTELSSGYVDVVFEGHTHKSYTNNDGQVWHIQAGSYNSGISEATVKYNILTNTHSTTVKIISVGEYNTYTKSDIIDTLIEKYADEIGNPDEVIGYNSSKRNSNYLKGAMARAYWDKGIEVWGDEYKIALAGGYINVRSPYSLSVGNVTVRDIQTLFPFDNKMHLCTIKGSDLKTRYLNNSSYIYVVDDAVVEEIMSGDGLDKTYYVVTDSYNTDYSPNRLTVVDTMYDDEGGVLYPRDLLCEYIQNGNLNDAVTTDMILQTTKVGNSLTNDDVANEAVEVYVTVAICPYRFVEIAEKTLDKQSLFRYNKRSIVFKMAIF